MKLLRRIGMAVAALLLVAAGVFLWAGFRTPPPLPPCPRPFPPAVAASGGAVFYNQAFAAMSELSEGEKRAIMTGSESFNSELVRSAVERFGPALDLIARGGQQPACDWGIDLNQGFTKPISHLSPAMKCAQALASRARLRLQDGDPEGAVDDLLAGFRLSRAVAEPPLLICLLVRYATDQVLLRAAAAELCRFSPSALRRLEDGIAALPPGTRIADALDWKREMIAVSLYTQALEMRSNAARAPLLDRCYWNVVSSVQHWAPFRLCWASARDLPQWTDAAVAACGALSPEMRKPFAEGRAGIEALAASERDNPFVANIANEVPRMREKECQNEAFRDAFLTALDARLRHPREERARIAAVQDRVTGKPVQCRDVPGGVEVTFTSVLPGREKKMTIQLEKPQP